MPDPARDVISAHIATQPRRSPCDDSGEQVPGSWPTAAATSPTALRRLWRDQSVRAGWAFPSDWFTPAVDALCDALCDAGPGVTPEPTAAGWRLGRDRARGAVCLAETLRDVDALLALLPASPHYVGSDVTRSVALGWAEGSIPVTDSIVDGLTGLANVGYLTVRMGEVYRAAEFEGCSARVTHALVVIRLARAAAPRWSWDLPMVLAADSARAVFSGGESLARLGPAVAAVLTRRHRRLGGQARALAELLVAGGSTCAGADGLPQVWIEQLPSDPQLLPGLLGDLAR